MTTCESLEFRRTLFHSTLEWHKSQVKRLYRSWIRSGKPASFEFPLSTEVHFDFSEVPNLMRFQHLYAISLGFTCWKDFKDYLEALSELQNA